MCEKLERLFKLITEDRLRESTRPGRGILTASESDKGRVINTAAFRRLQQKAQVFPLDRNAAVRTRLTHSIEVSQIGGYIAQKIIEKNRARHLEYDKLAAFVNTVQTACLLHDIGNPPFGHFGEQAIKEWFSSQNLLNDDLTEFDGNPQGFRIISFLNGKDVYGLNLTCTQLVSTVKYPWMIKSKPESAKKIGLFSMDYKTYEDACCKLSWTPGKKFPFVLLMEAADDIAYSMSDLEDGLEKNIISLDDLKSEFGRERFPEGNIEPFIHFKTDIINKSVDMVADIFSNNLEEILQGMEIKLIDPSSEIGTLLKKVNAYAKKYIYSDESAEQVELSGRSVITGLLEHFGKLLKIEEADFLAMITESNIKSKKPQFDYHIRLLRRLPKAYREKYCHGCRGGEIDRRAHLVVDFLSGMTDDFALETYQILQGIKIK
jgi:dGTPase